MDLSEVPDRQMMPTALTRLLDRIHEQGRDRILTALTGLMAVDLFVVAPMGAIHAVGLHPIRVTVLLLTLAGLLVLSRSIVPVAGIAAAVGLFLAAMILRRRGDHATLDACLEAAGWLVVGLVIIWVVARAVFAPGRITYHRVIGAVLLYLSIGFIFVALFTLVGALTPGSFTGLTITDRPTLPSDLVYFSFSTLTTVGFGDITPVHPFARSLSNVEAVIGQLYPATLVARLVSLEIGSRGG